MKIGFDNEKYLKMQSEHIRERINQFDNKLYLEFGGKLFDDYHASRVLPGFEPDSKLRLLKQLLMGALALELADNIVVTSDNPRTEDPELIIDEIFTALQNVPEGKHVTRLSDRRVFLVTTMPAPCCTAQISPSLNIGAGITAASIG